MPRPSSRFTVSHTLRLVLALGWSDFQLRYQGTLLGYLWVFVKPVVKFVVLYVVFANLLGSDIPHYPLYLFLGIILWEFFAVTSSECIAVLSRRQRVVERIRFPLIVLPLGVGWSNLIVLGAHVAIFLVAAFALGIVPSARMSVAVLVLAQLLLFTLGVGMALGAYCLRFKDIAHLWSVALQVLFWLTPIFYRPVAIGSRIAELIDLQPLSVLLRGARSALIYTQDPPAFSVLALLGVSVVMASIFAAGFFLFRARSPYFVEEY